MVNFKTIYFFLFLQCLSVQCTQKKDKYVRIWAKTGSLGNASIVDMTDNLFYDFTTGKVLFTENVFDTLYAQREYSSITINGESYYTYKKDEFFKHKKYNSLKIALLSKPDSIGERVPNRVYYVMQHYGIITIFKKREVFELQMIVNNQDTEYVRDFFPN